MDYPTVLNLISEKDNENYYDCIKYLEILYELKNKDNKYDVNKLYRSLMNTKCDSIIQEMYTIRNKHIYNKLSTSSINQLIMNKRITSLSSYELLTKLNRNELGNDIISLHRNHASMIRHYLFLFTKNI